MANGAAGLAPIRVWFRRDRNQLDTTCVCHAYPRRGGARAARDEPAYARTNTRVAAHTHAGTAPYPNTPTLSDAIPDAGTYTGANAHAAARANANAFCDASANTGTHANANTCTDTDTDTYT